MRLLAAARPCVVVSIGSNNQWGFEEAVASSSHCRVETFDCTVDATVPAPLRSRVTFHPFCLGVRDSAGARLARNRAQARSDGTARRAEGGY